MAKASDWYFKTGLTAEPALTIKPRAQERKCNLTAGRSGMLPLREDPTGWPELDSSLRYSLPDRLFRRQEAFAYLNETMQGLRPYDPDATLQESLVNRF